VKTPWVCIAKKMPLDSTAPGGASCSIAGRGTRARHPRAVVPECRFLVGHIRQVSVESPSQLGSLQTLRGLTEKLPAGVAHRVVQTFIEA